MDEWIKNIIPQLTIDDLPESYREVARIVGVENAVKLSDELGGLNYYFPKADSALMQKRNETIRKDFTGANIKELAKLYRLSEIQIREIVRPRKPRHDQPGLFENLKSDKNVL